MALAILACMKISSSSSSSRGLKIIHTQYIWIFFPQKLHSSAKKVSRSLSLSRWAVVAAAAACCCCICEKIYKEAKKKSSFSVLYIHRMNSNTTVEKASRRAHTACTWNFRQFIDVCVLAFSALLLLLLVSKCHAHTQTLYFHLFYSLPIQLTKNALGGTHWCRQHFVPTHSRFSLSRSLSIAENIEIIKKVFGWSSNLIHFWLFGFWTFGSEQCTKNFLF